MSLDLWLAKPECPTCQHTERTNSLNCTYNLSPMWHDIFPDDNGMVNIDGMTGKGSLIKLNFALSQLIGGVEYFTKMNPENGWGSYAGFVEFIKNLINLAERYPDYIWEACR